MNIKNALKLEEFAMLILGTLGFIYFGGTFIAFIIFLFAPDIGMIGYLINPLIGAYSYNITHNKGLAILLFILGMILKTDVLIFTGIIIFSHSSLDRVLGYGLKHRNSFNNTHLEQINNKHN